MKKLTTNQWLLVGGTVAIIWILFGKKKMNATNIKKEIEKDLGSKTGGIKSIPEKYNKICEEKYQQWLEVSKVSRFGSPEARDKAKKEILGDCFDYTPVKSSIPTNLVLPLEKTAIITR